jgi:hypothetical protein
LALTGCPTDSGGDDTPQTVVPGTGVGIDRTVNTVTDLAEAIRDDEVQTVAFVINEPQTLTGLGVIPYGKTLYLLNYGAKEATVSPGDGGLSIRGTLIVSEKVALVASTSSALSLWSDGSIQIKAKGRLQTDKRLSVSDYTDAGVGQKSVLTTNVRYSGGSTLTITGEGDVLDIADIEALLSALDPGTARQATVTTSGPSKLELKDLLKNIKPSEVAAIANVSAERRLALIPAEKEADLTELTIPAGAEVTIEQPLKAVKKLTVDGVIKATEQIGGGTGGNDTITITLAADAELELTENISIKIEAASKIAAGAKVSGDVGDIPAGVAEVGAVVNGTTIKEGATGKITTVKVGNAALTVATGETAVIKGEVEFTAKITVAEGGTLVIPTGSKLTLGNSGEIDTAGQGKIIVEGTGTAPDMPKLTVGTGTNENGIDTTAEVNPPKLELISAEKDLKTGNITVKVGGTITDKFTAWALGDQCWGSDHEIPGPEGPKTGYWSWGTFDGILSSAIQTNGGSIKQTNLALRYYQGKDVLLDKEPTEAVAAGTGLYADATKAIKWKSYTTTDSYLSVLFWSGASPKTATLVIDPGKDSNQVDPPAYTVIVDWSALTINPAPAE